MSVLDLIRPDLKSLQNYKPGGDHLDCRLHANELPWCPVAFSQVPLNQYPDIRQQHQLQQLLAQYYQVSSEQLVLTRGSDDGIDLLMRLFLRPGQDCFMQCPPTFPMYEFYARLQQAEVLNCPLDAKNDFSLSIESLISFWQPHCKLIMLCRPNNPTGNALDLASIKTLCEYFQGKAIIVVDEAYIEFAQTESATELLSFFDNLIVLRTLSKAYGLAGLRLGSIIAQAQLIKAIESTMPPYTLSSAVIDLAKQALANKAWFTSKIDDILNERQGLITQLQQFPWIEKIYPSSANFILIASTNASSLAAWLAELGIAVRHFAAAPLQNMLRITVGDSAQNQQLLAALRRFQPEG
ncbi:MULTISPECIES: histidinol-phosphate transaminase [Legionella]|uniref:Histidinol-phosphate aminotransferase n=1 Tax=Legionella maceachernii TaxID=466 RepID=A0A0W0VYW0_9GAMM|nr:histidinol-phosphate transaminase [Legionella maceachernii]KTD25231.1 histidinol-phosphate aminotransferase (imidazole acetol-phosphate transaminase) [Legionella maceachernii]SJZ76916.1 histidinol-phosphate aminotransferase [Legionella maceachernii]SUP03073.1 Histidinol-phosphate aminotransferase [Legionella maceachernii]